MAAGRQRGVEAKAQGAVAHIAVHPVGTTDAQVLDEEDAAAVVADRGTKGVVADGAAVEGGVTAAALEGVVAAAAKDVIGAWTEAKSLPTRSAVEDRAAAGDGGVSHRPEPNAKGLS